MVRLCESREITPQIYLFLLKYASFSQKKFKIFAYSKKMLYFCSTKFQDIHNKDFIPMCKHSRGERESELLFSLLLLFVEFQPAEFGFVERALHLLVAGGGFGYRLRVGQAAGELLLQSRFLLLQQRHLLLQLR